MRLPEIDHYGNKIPEGSIFFKIPGTIGDIVSASTSYFEGQRPLNSKEQSGKYIKNISMALGFGLFIVLIGRVTNPIWFSIWLGIPIIIAIIISNRSTKFKCVCNYIGTNGFAEYSFLNTPENIISSNEISFDNVTDLLIGSTVRKRNYSYEGTDYFFLWLNNGRKVFKVESTHQNKNNEPDKYPFSYYFMALAVEQWTKRLITQMPKKLQEEGFLEFDLIVYQDSKWINAKHIRMGIGFIEFIFSTKTIRYNHDEIKKMYFQDGSLFLEHNNYEKKLLGFLEKGDKNEIPLNNLSNQAYFFHAIEKLMGYSL